VLSNNDQQALLAWYDEHQRDLPWRQTNDPWAILLSEILLQQTQVSRGLIYWQRMVETFPTVGSMAAAPVDAVLKAWEGAGYYSRARRLHALSQRVMMPKAEGGFDGQLPSTYDELLSLPGIGPYTAAAVASIAFRHPVACVDGNIRRVMARQTAQADPTPKQVQEWADGSLETERPGDWNQSLMELGATVCTPKRWACGTCPLRASCAGTGDPGAYPTPKKQRVTALHLVAVVEFALDGHPVLHQRPMSGMFAGLWGPMYREDAMPKDEGLVDCGTVNHQLSHKKIKVQVYVSGSSQAPKGIRRSDVALSTLDEKVLNLAAEHVFEGDDSAATKAKG
jgi:A/G-specific adenine glycosylase